MMQSYIWEKELIEHLIMLWEQKEVLYASVTTDYECKRQRLDALNEIYLELSQLDETITLDIVKMKLHMLRSQYCKEFKRLREYSKRGLTVVPKLEWYEHLMFLVHSVQGRPAAAIPKPSTPEQEVVAPPAKKRKLPVENTSDDEFIPDNERIDADNEEKESEAIHDWLEKKIDDLKAKLEKHREYKTAAKSRTESKKQVVEDEEEEELAQKPRSFKWLAEQVVFELNELHSQRLQEDAAWAIQKILHESLLKARRVLKNRNVTQSNFSDDYEPPILPESLKEEALDEDTRVSIEQLFLEHFD